MAENYTEHTISLCQRCEAHPAEYRCNPEMVQTDEHGNEIARESMVWYVCHYCLVEMMVIWDGIRSEMEGERE